MSKDKLPTTAAVRVLRAAGVDFTAHPYAYEERGGTEVSARELGVCEHAVIKTLVMEDGQRAGELRLSSSFVLVQTSATKSNAIAAAK